MDQQAPSQNVSSLPKDSSESKTGFPDASVKIPVKTVIKIESPRSSANMAEDVKPPVSTDKRDSDSVSSTSSLSQNSSSDPEASPLAPKRQYRSPTLDVRKRVTPFSLNEEQPEYINSARKLGAGSENVEYMNIGRNRKFEGGNSSDTDSGVGGESDRPAHLIRNGGESRHGFGRRGEELQEENDGWGGDLMETGSLLHQSDLQLDLSKY